MKFTRTVTSVGCVLLLLAVLMVVMLQNSTFARDDGSNARDRTAIEEKLLYAYAYAYDSKDCASWAKLFTADAVLNLGGGMKATGREALLQGCLKRQESVVGDIKTRHYMTNIVFDQLTAQQAKTRTYVVITWQKPGDMTPNVQLALVYRDVIVKQADGRWLFKERVAVDPPNQ
jgi:ketosteroid isomerase-like protein